jgi:hypothetical protein
MAHAGASTPARRDIEAPARYDIEPSGHPEPSAQPARPAHPVHRTRHRRLLVTMGVAATLAVGLTGVDVWLAQDALAPATSSQMVSEALAAAAAAEAAYHDVHGAYTADRDRLGLAGWLSTYDADVVLVTAGTDGFCIAAGPTGAAPVAWIDQDWKQLDKACG